MDLKAAIRTIPHWPKPGIMFRDITSLLQHPAAFQHTCDAFYQRYSDAAVDKVVGIDARGFIFASVLAYHLGSGLVLARKKGKLPGSTRRQHYDLEYGSDALEINDDAIASQDRVVIIDDLIATGGTALAAVQLVAALGGDVVECAFVIELPALKGRERLAPHAAFSLVAFYGH